MKKRCKELIDLQGRYLAMNSIDSNRQGFIAQYLEYIEANVVHKDGTAYYGKMKLGKFLNQAGFKNDEVSRFIEAIKPYEFTISCRFKDILAATDSHHFSSCLSPDGCNRKAVDGILKDPYVAVAIRRDKAGHVLGRMWIRLVKLLDNSHAIVVYPSYGEISRNAVAQAIKDDTRGILILTYRSSEINPIQRIDYYDDIFPLSWFQEGADE